MAVTIKNQYGFIDNKAAPIYFNSLKKSITEFWQVF